MGPLSESSIGNVGLPVHWWDADCKALHIRCVDRTGVSDMVMNEVGGTAITIASSGSTSTFRKGSTSVRRAEP